MTFELAIPFITAFFLTLIRTGALFLSIPFFGGDTIPVRLRASFALIMALTLTPSVGPIEQKPLMMMFLMAGGEFILGLAMGLTVKLTLFAAEFAGEVAGMQMGFSFSRVVDPNTNEDASVIGRILETLAVLILLAIDGHRTILASLIQSVSLVPVGTAFPSGNSFAPLLNDLTTAFVTGIRIAAPVIVALLLTDAALGLMARAAPQVQLFVFAFAITLAVGILILSSSLPFAFKTFVDQLQLLPDHLHTIMGA